MNSFTKKEYEEEIRISNKLRDLSTMKASELVFKLSPSDLQIIDNDFDEYEKMYFKYPITHRRI